MKKIPITILTGFLGSGKTTLINKILAHTEGKKIAIIENELGTIGIDKKLITAGAPLGSIQGEQIIQVAQGCVCCTVRGDLSPALHELMQSGIEIDHIILETTGIADPLPIMQTIVSDPYISLQFKLSNVVTVFDAMNFDATKDMSPTSIKQLALADGVYVSKLDMGQAPQANTTHNLKIESKRTISEINPHASILYSDELFLIDHFFESSIHATKRVTLSQSLGVSSLPRSHDIDISTHLLSSEQTFRSVRTHAWLTSITHALEQNILRIKGFVQTEKGTYTVNCVRDSVSFELLEQIETTSTIQTTKTSQTAKTNQQLNTTELVIIGYKLSDEMLKIIQQGFNDLGMGKGE